MIPRFEGVVHPLSPSKCDFCAAAEAPGVHGEASEGFVFKRFFVFGLSPFCVQAIVNMQPCHRGSKSGKRAA